MKHLGDITKIHGDKIEPVDCITFGSPCQDLSIAGHREGLAGERSGLFMEAVRIIKEMRSSTNGMYPTFAVWENVPGAFSSNGGEDFRTVLEELARIAQPDVSIPRPPRGGRWSKAGAICGNKWSLAWRQLDAQYWGVPQRRKRIALVADFRGQRAGTVLFEQKSLSRHPDSCIPAWEEIAGLTANCPAGNDGVVGAGGSRKGDGDAGCRRTKTDKTGETGRSEREERTDKRECGEAAAYTLKIRSGCAGGGKGALVQAEKVGTLSTLQDQTLFQLVQVGEVIPINTQIATRHVSLGECTGMGWGKAGDPAYTLQAGHEHGVCYCIAGNIVDRSETAGANGVGATENVSYTLNTVDRHAVAYSAVFENHSQDARYTQQGNTSPTCIARYGTGGNNIPLVVEKNAFTAISVERRTFNEQSFSHYKESDKCSTLKAKAGNIGNGSECLIAEKAIRWIVRRLTPVECERLQGYPDDYTNIGDWTDSKGKKHKYADSPRYKALGNSIALPQWFWLVQKMRPYLKEKPKLGSLFDGIGGFPLVWQRAYGEGTARWASEIEEFPMAVTKRRFGEE